MLGKRFPSLVRVRAEWTDDFGGNVLGLHVSPEIRLVTELRLTRDAAPLAVGIFAHHSCNQLVDICNIKTGTTTTEINKPV